MGSRQYSPLTDAIWISLAVRIGIAVCTRTFFQPDEYFQALEPAHHFVFGYGHLTWEWVNSDPIRGILYPSLNIVLYWVLKVCGLDDGQLLIIVPKVLHGLLAAATDIFLARLTRRFLGERYVNTVLLVSLTSFFNALSLSRSLSNSLETSLTTIAFSYYPWDANTKLSPQLLYNRDNMRKVLIFAALACSFRITNALIWVFLVPYLLWCLGTKSRAFYLLLSDTFLVGAMTICFNALLDSLYYRQPVLVSLNFLRINLSGISLFYGTASWHYYITQGIPILCTSALPYVLHGMWSSMRSSRLERVNTLLNMLVTIVWTVSVYSMIGHKEWRFIHPVLPLLHIFAAKSLIDLSDIPAKKGDSKQRYRPVIRVKSKFPVKSVHVVVLLSTIPLSFYCILLYCSGPISVMSYIRKIPSVEQVEGVGVLMPCHSIPGHAYIHREELNKTLWSLGCEPPLGLDDATSYKDQTDVFFDSPMGYMKTYFPSKVDPRFPLSPYPTSPSGVSAVPPYPWKHEWPRHLIFFGSLLNDDDGIYDFLIEKGYHEVWTGGRSWEGDGEKRKGGVRVWRWGR